MFEGHSLCAFKCFGIGASKSAIQIISRFCVGNSNMTNWFCNSTRATEADREARSGRPAGRDEGGEEEDGHGEEGVHPGALSLSALSPAHHHFHPAAALPAAVRNQCGES